MVPALKRKAEVILDPEVEKAKEEEKKEDLVNPMDLDHIFGEFTAEQTRTLKCLADFILFRTLSTGALGALLISS